MDIKNTLSRFDITPNKALGQNFLADTSAISSIIDIADVEGKSVVEIGPGLGALTFGLNAKARAVCAIELDKHMVLALEAMRDEFSNPDTLEIIRADCLKADIATIVGRLYEQYSAPVCVVGNLPYYITTPIIQRLIALPEQAVSFTLMTQREAATRVVALPRDSQYGPVSVISQYAFDIKTELELSPTSYYPQPDVYSVVFSMRRKATADSTVTRKLIKLVPLCFVMRRKTIYNNLCAAFEKQRVTSALDTAGIMPNQRAEALCVDDFVRLSECIYV